MSFYIKNLSVKHRVDIIGAALERSDPHSAVKKCLQHRTGYSCFPTAAMRTAYDYSIQALTPFITKIGFSAESIV